ncbi:MAG: PD-(D/E)XK nuclease family protein [Candidatus Muiribacteriota bacterium]
MCISEQLKDQKKPNLFKFATKELSQDAFFAWLFSWADPLLKNLDQNLHNTSVKLIRRIVHKDNLTIEKIEVKRQLNNIDIVLLINDEIIIAIEDKTYTKSHNDQLNRYKKFIEEESEYKNFIKFFIYIKTRNESKYSLNENVEKKGFEVISRSYILEILKDNKSDNAIFKDYYDYLFEIEERTNKNIKNFKADWKACEGFYMKIEEEIFNNNEEEKYFFDWGYVPNKRGGFLSLWQVNGFWLENIDEYYYIVFENYLNGKAQLVLKVADNNMTTQKLYEILDLIKKLNSNNGLNIKKPEKYRAGRCSTLAIIDEKIGENIEDVDKIIESFILKYKKGIDFIENLAEHRRKNMIG